MKRYNKSDIEFIDFCNLGTAADFIGRNKITDKKGIYKKNGCMLGVTNEDVREKLASQIISKLEIDCAQIDLVYDIEINKNACFSNYIINDEEEILVEPTISNVNSKKNDKVENFVENYLLGVAKISNNKEFLKECRDNLYRYIYTSCIIDSYDLKGDNIPIIQNVKTNKFRVCPWFDFGVAFKEDAIQKKQIFSELSSDTILDLLYSNHYDKIKSISDKVNEVFTNEEIEEIFSQDYIQETFQKEELEKIKNRFINQIEKSNKLKEEKSLQLQEKKNDKNGLVNIFDKLKQRMLGLKNIFSGQKSLPALKQDNIIQCESKHENDAYIKFNNENVKLVNDIKDIVSNDNKMIYDNAEKVKKYYR